jgi:hypothetical protein
MVATARHQRNGKPSTNGHAASPPITTAAAVPEETPNDPPAPDRGANGRFTPGNSAGTKNPFHRATAARRKALLEAVTDEDVAAVARKLRDQALAGDVAAAKVLLTFVVGKPAAVADPDRADLDELAVLMASPLRRELVAQSLEGTSTEAAMNFLKALLPRVGNTDIFDSSRGFEAAAEVLDFIRKLYASRAGRA